MITKKSIFGAIMIILGIGGFMYVYNGYIKDEDTKA